MKKLLFTLLFANTLLACSKDDNNAASKSECGAVISLDKTRKDGGIRETVSMVVCGDAWRSFDGANMQSAILVSKGESRASATYLVATKSDTIYIRYDQGNVPNSTVDSFANVGYATKVATLTGLEHIKWPE